MEESRVRRTLGRLSTTAMLVAGSVGVILLMLETVANALSRKLFDYPIPGTTVHGGMWYLPVIAFVGFAIAQQEGKHIEVRLVVDRLPKVTRTELAVFGYVVSLAMLSVLVWTTLTRAIHNFAIGLTAGVTGVTVWPLTFLPPLCFAILAVQNVAAMACLVLDRKRAGLTTDVEADGTSAKSENASTTPAPELLNRQ